MNKYAFVTGAGRGLGLELVKKLIENGYTVFAGKYISHLQHLDKLKNTNPEKLFIMDINISSDESVKKACEFIKSKTNKLDILINNAAVLGDIEATIFDEIDFSDILDVLNINALGPLRVTNSLIGLIANGADKLVVNISSEAGSVGDCTRKGWFGYCMSKSALNMQSALVHNNLKEIGGQVLAIHPGWLRTNMRGHLDEDAPLLPEEAADRIMRLILNKDHFKGEHLSFIDNAGNKMQF